MYHATGLTSAAAGAGTLAYTGFGLVWIVLAAFALIAAGSAVHRLAPKAQA